MPGGIIATIGLPGSGKTTYTEEVLRQMREEGNGDLVVRVGRDHIRRMLHGGHVGTDWQEQQVSQVQNMLIRDNLRQGRLVLVDDMNLRMSYRNRLRTMADDHGGFYVQHDLTNVPLHECILRNSLRNESQRVPERLIQDLHDRYIRPLKGQSAAHPPVKNTPTELDYSKVEFNPKLPRAVIFDIDGTVALIPEGGRSPYDYTRVLEDIPNHKVIRVLEDLAWDSDSVHFFAVSGRKDSCRKDTEKWLFQNIGLEPSGVFMRRADDDRPDYIIKHEIFDRNFRDRYDVMFVLDDRDQVVDMWRSLGLLCFQVERGDF